MLLQRNEPQIMGGATMLGSMADMSAAAAFFDPQYRAVLDKLNYGNEGSRQKGRARLPQQSTDDINFLISELARVLKHSGHLFLWMDKFTLATGTHLHYLRGVPQLQRVDLIHWNKIRPGMGKRARCQSEYLMAFQKRPVRAKGCWRDNRIPDSWPEAADRARHPHAKPIALAARLIRAVTRSGDLVVDPAAGGYGVLEACRLTGRQFVGCDLVGITDEQVGRRRAAR